MLRNGRLNEWATPTLFNQATNALDSDMLAKAADGVLLRPDG